MIELHLLHVDGTLKYIFSDLSECNNYYVNIKTQFTSNVVYEKRELLKVDVIEMRKRCKKAQVKMIGDFNDL
jgi:hypothetical protein